MARYLEHFVAGVRADVQQLVTVNFEALSTEPLHDLFNAVMILRIAQKTLPSYVWKQCASYRNGLINYKRMNDYLESYMGAKQKAELAQRRQWSLEKKKQILREYVAPPSQLKKKESSFTSQPIIGGINPIPLA